MSALHVYFVGASGVGKSTLARHVAQEWKLPLLSGATRQAAQAMGGFPGHLPEDLGVANAFQKAVWAAQVALESPHWSPGGEGFVSDRGFESPVSG